MLRLTVCFFITSFLFVINVGKWQVESVISLTRLTNTPEHAINLNPTLSDDGKVVVFESSADLAGTGANSSFHAIRADLDSAFKEIGATRTVCPALSSDGKIVAFASAEDLVGENEDRNSEIFLFDGVELKQVTQTEPASVASRLTDGNFQPSITGEGRTIAFSSKREIFLYDVVQQRFKKLTNGTPGMSAVSPKISADGSRVYYKRAADNVQTADLMLIETTTGTEHVLA